MDNKALNIQSSTKAKPIRELLPELKGIISKDCMRNLMAAQPTPRRVDLKPLSYTELRSVLMELKDETTVKCTPAVNPNRKSRWNSSVKVPKTEPKHVTSKESSARKTLKLQPKPMTFTNPVTPKVMKPVWNGKKSIVPVPDKNNIRISGVYSIPETPTNKSNSVYKNRKTLFNKENEVKKGKTIESNFRKPLKAITDAPLSNISSTSSCDSSFLQTEKKIHDLISKSEAKPFKGAGPMLENIEEVSPILSTPPEECNRNEDFLFNNNDTEQLPSSNSIICFDVINQSNLNCMQLNDLLKLKQQNEGKIKIMEQYLKTMMEQQIYIEKMIKEKNMDSQDYENKENICKNKLNNPESVTKDSIVAIPCSVIKSPLKSPTYKIPRKNLCLRKKVFHKSMPNISNGTQSPNKDNDNKALTIYMKMKEQMIFLNTPVKSRNIEAPNTPAVTSQNLQMQLDKLYNCS